MNLLPLLLSIQKSLRLTTKYLITNLATKAALNAKAKEVES